MVINDNNDITSGGQSTCYIRDNDFGTRGTNSNSLFFNLNADDTIKLENTINISLARKRTGDAEIGWRPTPEKNIETMPCWGENSPENCLVDLGRDTRTSIQSRRLVRRKGASWSLNALIGLLERIR